MNLLVFCCFVSFFFFFWWLDRKCLFCSDLKTLLSYVLVFCLQRVVLCSSYVEFEFLFFPLLQFEEIWQVTNTVCTTSFLLTLAFLITIFVVTVLCVHIGCLSAQHCLHTRAREGSSIYSSLVRIWMISFNASGLPQKALGGRRRFKLQGRFKFFFFFFCVPP